MMSADDCRDLAKWYRARADDELSSPRRTMLRDVAHSLSSLATQLEMMAREPRQAGVPAHQGADAGLQVTPPPADIQTGRRV
jgi:hypothetical protein